VVSVVGEHRVDLVGDGGDQAAEEVCRGLAQRLLVQLDEGELRRAVDRHQHVELALLRAHLGDVDVEVADGIGLELPLGGDLTFGLRQSGDAVALKAAVQRGSRQVRDRRLQSIQAVIQRKQRVPSKGNEDRFLLDRQNRRARSLGPCGNVRHRRAALPLGDRLLVDPVTLRKSPQALLTMLYRSTDRLSCRGAPMENLAHNESFQSDGKAAPSNSGIKHLAPVPFGRIV
jgi:hypothetical protein